MHADLAGIILDLVEKFAGLGFNKSHSAALRSWCPTRPLAEGALPGAVHGGGVVADNAHITDKVVTLD